MDERFTASFVPTVGIDFHVKTVDLADGRRVKLQLWDTAGQERFHNVTKTYFRGAAAVLLVYDVTDRDSFEWVTKWRDQVAEFVGTDVNQVVFAVVGNKVDRAAEDRVVSAEEGRTKAKQVGAPIFFETSAKTGENVSELFLAVAEAAAAKMPSAGKQTSSLAEDKGLRLDGLGGAQAGGASAASSCGGACGGAAAAPPPPAASGAGGASRS